MDRECNLVKNKSRETEDFLEEEQSKITSAMIIGTLGETPAVSIIWGKDPGLNATQEERIQNTFKKERRNPTSHIFK